MTENVISAFGTPLPHEPVQGVIDELELLLSMAKSGEIRGLAHTIYTKQGHVNTGWHCEPSIVLQIGCAVNVLALEYNNFLLDELGDN